MSSHSDELCDREGHLAAMHDERSLRHIRDPITSPSIQALAERRHKCSNGDDSKP